MSDADKVLNDPATKAAVAAALKSTERVPRKRVTSKPVPVVPQSPPPHPEADLPDTDHKYGKPGKGKRTFTLLDPPTKADNDSPILYTLYEVNADGNTVLIDHTFTSDELEKFVTEKGQWLA